MRTRQENGIDVNEHQDHEISLKIANKSLKNNQVNVEEKDK